MTLLNNHLQVAQQLSKYAVLSGMIILLDAWTTT
jgi:hypothetical protein